jgi:hypothetical protein
MAKQKQQVDVVGAPATQLALVNFDDIESIEVEETPAAKPELAQPVVDTEEQALATLESFDVAFANDPLKADWLEFGNTARKYTDPSDKATLFVHLSQMQYNLMVKERNIAPGSYKRSAVIKKSETVFRLCNVPESEARPHEIAMLFWLVHLDRSNPGADGEARTFNTSEIPAQWFGGSVTLGALRVLAKCITRVSKDNEVDMWEYKSGYEAKVREWIVSLRADKLVISQLKVLIEHRANVLAAERKAAKYQGLNADEIASIEASEKNESLQSKLNELSSLGLKVQKYAAEELKKSPADVRDFLANKGIIPPDRFPNIDEIAAHLTPGDAKALVQALITQYVTKPDRLQVFKVLRNTANAVVAQLKSSAQEQTKKVG